MGAQMTGKEFQQELFKKIKSKLPGHVQLSHAVAELLHISEATAYRRLNGEVLFSTDELLLLVQHYQLSVDDLLNINNNEFLFSGYLMEGNSASFLNYLSNMGNMLQLVSENNGQLTCFNKDVPIFYQFCFPELAWFKYFFWQKHILLVPELQHRKFSLTECPKELADAGYLMEGNSASFLNYLSNMGNMLQLVSEKNGQLTCFNKDVPIFYQFCFPELAWFKYFFWQKHILLVPELQHRKFSLTECPKELADAGYRIYYNYQRIDSTELWNIESIHTTLRQMVYSRQIHEYKRPDDINILLDQLFHIIETIKLQAEKGEKISFSQNRNDQPTGKSFKLYYNEFFLADNSYLVNLNDRVMAIVNHSVINYIQTQNIAFNQYLQKHFENILSRSTPISKTNAKEREMFFNKLVHKIEQVRT